MAKLIIEAGHTEKHYWADLWRYRELLYFLAWRDVLVRYKQTIAGVAWAVMRPFLTMLIMTLVFGKIAQLPSSGSAPYALMVFAAMLPWQFFANALSSSSESLVGNANLISKVYFPRFIIPGSAVVVSFIDFAVSFLLMIVVMGWYSYWPDWRVLSLPLFVLLAFLAALGPGLLLTALTVKYRDMRFVVPFVVQFGLYLTPVGFSSSLVREKIGADLFLIYSLNPMVNVIEGFRWALLRGEAFLYFPGIAASVGCGCVFLWFSIRYFRATERTFADVI